jgi:hypothetical protein
MQKAQDDSDPSGKRFRRKGTKRKPKGLWRRITGFASWLDAPFRFVGTLSAWGLMFAVIGTSLGMYFQYTAWREEKELARYKDDLSNATATFTELTQTLSSVMNLQQILFFLFREAATKNVLDQKNSYLSKSSEKVYKEYFDERTALGKKVDLFARKAEIFIDRPINPDRTLAEVRKSIETRIEPRSGLFAAEKDLLSRHGFDCKFHLPHLGRLTIEGLTIDWKNARHHIVTFYYCLERVHSDIMTPGVWASGNTISPQEANQFLAQAKTIEESLENQILRLNAFMFLVMHRIEEISLRNRPKSFACHINILPSYFGCESQH